MPRLRPLARHGAAAATPRAAVAPPAQGATTSTTCPPVPSFAPLPPPPPVQAAVELLFKFPPLFDKAVKTARTKIEKRAEALGYSFPEAVQKLKAEVSDWEGEKAAVEDASVVYPA